MLREILAITGRPSLFKIVSHSGNRLIVEDVQSKRRFPISPREKVVSLGDIAMYTDGDDKPLGEILDLVFSTHEGKPVDMASLKDNASLAEAFATVLPDYDRDRVYPTDIKKLFSWYNILIATGMTRFTEDKHETSAEDSETSDTK